MLQATKGQTIWNDFFKWMFLQKNEQINLTLLLVNLFLFVFWKKVKTPKRHFEINWPVEHFFLSLVTKCQMFFGKILGWKKMTNNDVWSLESRKVRSHRDMTYFFSRMSKKGDAKTSFLKDRMLVIESPNLKIFWPTLESNQSSTKITTVLVRFFISK